MQLMPKPTKPIDTQEWFPVALVLVCEDRQCKACQRTFRVPNSELMVRLANPLYRSLNSRLVKRSNWPADIEDLPHEVQIETSWVERCHYCFNGNPGGQLLLFPLRKRVRPSFKELLARKQAEQLHDDLAKRANKKKPAAERPISEQQRNRMKARALFSSLSQRNK